MSKKSNNLNKKHLIFTLVFSLIASFTLFIYEPIVMYAGNINEFWFDLRTLLTIMILPFLVSLVVFCLIYTIFYILTRKKPKVFYVIEILSFVGFIYFYIHGNFLSSILPSLYGDTINWWAGEMIIGHIISAVLFIVMLIAIIIGLKKSSVNEVAKYGFYTTIAFTAMMAVSFVTTLVTPGVFVDKDIQPIATTKNINKVSSDRNFYILLLDCTDSWPFNEYVQEKYSDTFKDFTYFEDAASGYSSTRDSIPLIFSGIFYKNKTNFNDFSTKALNNSKTFAELEDERYNMNFYNNDFVWNSKKSRVFSNFTSDISNYGTKSFLKQQMKYTLYKYLPFELKFLSKIESMDFTLAIQESNANDLFNWKNIPYYENVLLKEPEKTNEKLFQYVHLEGSHSPYDMDEELNIISNKSGTYNQKIGASAKLASLAIERIKKSGSYDNSIIVVMADHGWETHVPVLYIKGVNEKHTKMQISDKQVSYEDLDEAFTKLINESTAEDAFEGIPTSGRTRYFYTDFYYEKKPIIEFINKGGKSYDHRAWEATGNEYPIP